MNDKKREKMELERRTPEMANPFQMMRRFTKDMERMFEGFNFPAFFRTDFAPFRMEFENVQWVPQIEVLQNNGQFMVRADLPGLTKDDVTVEMTDDILTIFGERKKETEEKREGFYRTERVYSSFFRTLPLPENMKIENAKAIVHDGVLEITVPMAKVETKTKKLEITEPVPPKTVKVA